MYTFEFTTRETYLQYKEEWKQRYAAQVKEQRRLKLAIRESMRTGKPKPPCYFQWDYIYGVRLVKELLAERQVSKDVASKQWEAKHRATTD